MQRTTRYKVSLTTKQSQPNPKCSYCRTVDQIGWDRPIRPSVRLAPSAARRSEKNCKKKHTHTSIHTSLSTVDHDPDSDFLCGRLPYIKSGLPQERDGPVSERPAGPVPAEGRRDTVEAIAIEFVSTLCYQRDIMRYVPCSSFVFPPFPVEPQAAHASLRAQGPASAASLSCWSCSSCHSADAPSHSACSLVVLRSCFLSLVPQHLGSRVVPQEAQDCR